MCKRKNLIFPMDHADAWEEPPLSEGGKQEGLKEKDSFSFPDPELDYSGWEFSIGA